MNNFKSYALAAIGIISLVASLSLNFARASNAESPAVVSATGLFGPNFTYVLTPANGTGQITCRVIKVDGDWIKCGGEKFEWVNTRTMMYASDSK